MYSPQEALSLDESLLLFRGRLKFRVYIKNKKSKCGIKFYELCSSSDGSVLNVDIYKGKNNSDDARESSTGHYLYIDNFYTNLQLLECLPERKTHTTETLRSNRKRNPKEITEAKLRAGEHVWRRCGNTYVSKWGDKREVLAITTGYQPKLIETTNKYGQNKVKPIEVAGYNDNMSGIDRADQMISYYSCPRKSIRWNKKAFRLIKKMAESTSLMFQIKRRKKSKKGKVNIFLKPYPQPTPLNERENTTNDAASVLQ
ncbi:hypothetical protein NQ314_005307 [Rhamnusium bicolor]|uniref:PiggyBac transposable element-derived protein domain-containing protein n=1 Tax=Rhamnusium bicolor TaxID=1586634 RepID=A0AAV8ZHB4_9CUCU|nr:hypothetical protein NQ314_005307 [Rhamnusium bicolor]